MRTMKIMKQMMSLAAAILALSGCSSEDDILSAYHNDPDAVHITAEVGKASADGFLAVIHSVQLKRIRRSLMMEI